MMEGVTEVDIDPEGVFKYILIEVTDGRKRENTSKPKVVVRGYSWAEYHADILDRVAPRFAELGLDYECAGGGRIRHSSKNKTLHIYGYSVGFGQANHKMAKDILQRQFGYPDENVTWSNAGY